jgi:hypothetical protein
LPRDIDERSQMLLATPLSCNPARAQPLHSPSFKQHMIEALMSLDL